MHIKCVDPTCKHKVYYSGFRAEYLDEKCRKCGKVMWAEDEYLDELYQAKIIVFQKGIRYKEGNNGIRTANYVNARDIRSFPELNRRTVRKMIPLYLEVDLIFAVERGATPFGVLLSDKKDTPLITAGSEKNYGLNQPIVGRFNVGDKAVIIEDVATTGGSILESAKLCRRHGIKINDAICVIDRQEGAEQLLAENNIQLHSLYRMTDVLAYLRHRGLITDKQYNDSMAQIKS